MSTGDVVFRRWHAQPPLGDGRSQWFRDAMMSEGFESTGSPSGLEGKSRAGVCIVGGGYTGLWTAITLKERQPDSSVTVLEADLCGGGASGRNSGGVGDWWSKLPTLVRALGPADALRVIRASVDATDRLVRFITDHEIQCELVREASLWTATTPSQVGAWEGVLAEAERLGVEAPYKRLTSEELDAMLPADGRPLDAVLDERSAQLQPALLARGLRRVAIQLGVEIYEHSPVTRIASKPADVVVHTPGGTVRADEVVLAANAWMAHLRELRPAVMVVSSDIVMTEPIPERLAALGLGVGSSGMTSTMMVNYYGVSTDGRLVFGRGGGTLAFDARVSPEFERSPRQLSEVERNMRHMFPSLADVPIASSWSGAVDRSTTGLPWFGRLERDNRIHYGIGYTGHGVGATVLAGRLIAQEVLCGDDDEATRIALALRRLHRGGFPPEPLRYLGGRIVRAALGRKEYAEALGGRPRAIDTALSRLAPSTVLDVRTSPGHNGVDG